MTNTEFSLRDINTTLVSQFPAIVRLPKVAAPFTTVQNRALMSDFTNDLLPRMGIDRVTTHSLMEVQGESGPNGERVYKPVNDIHDQVRFVGSWNSLNNVVGLYQQPSNLTTNYIEISFYGTGLNIIGVLDSTYSAVASLDGGSEGSNFLTNTSVSGVLLTRNVSVNQITPVLWAGGASSTTLGFHTVKIRNTSVANGFGIYGFEVVNSSSSVQLLPGQSFNGVRRLNKSTLSTSVYNTTFESGTLGTKGGRVLVYQKADGSVVKAVNPAPTSPSFLGSASHSNEEMVRSYYYREFGAGRSDDFSLAIPSAADKAFTLDDGTTTLQGFGVRVDTSAAVDGVQPVNNSSSYVSITFVGTGLDVVWAASATGTNANANSYEWYVDGALAGNLTTVSPGVNVPTIAKIASGLPYGTHTVRLQKNVPGTWAASAIRFNVYAPAKPALPSGAIELADYCIMADFVANSTAGVETIATGVLRKAPNREMVYVNGTGGTGDWTISASLILAGTQTSTDRQNAYVEYVFFGTGFEQRFQAAANRSANIQVSLQALSSNGSLQNLTTTNFPTITTSVYGTGIAFNATTGILDQQDAATQSGCGLRVSGLTLGLYKVRFLNNTASSYIVMDGLDIVTPIHSVKFNGPFVLQNTLSVGSQGIRDLRNFGEQQVLPLKAISQAMGVSSSNTTSASALVPLADMSTTIKTFGNPIDIRYFVIARNDTLANVVLCQIYVNGTPVGQERRGFAAISQDQSEISDSLTVPVSAGVHKIDVYWYVTGGVGEALGALRSLTVREL